MVSPLKLGFAGSPDFAARVLQALLDGGHRPAVVYCQPDRPVGRGRRLSSGPVKVLADALGIPVLQPESLRSDEAVATLAGFQLDVLVVAAYGLILPQSVLDTPRFGCINVHASLLPRWRGAAPVERAIMAGDTRTGVSIMQMDRGLDTGPVYALKECSIGPHTTGPALEAELARLGGTALLDCLCRIPGLEAKPQPAEGATYAKKLTEADAWIDWSRSSLEIDRQIRALCGRIPARTFAGSARMQILDAFPHGSADSRSTPGTVVAVGTPDGITVACGKGTLSIRRLQLNRGKGQPLTAAQALNGFSELLGEGCVFHAEPT